VTARLPINARLPANPRLPVNLGVAIALAPFAIFIVLFEAIPIVALLIGSVGQIDHPTFKYLAAVFTQPAYRQSVVNTILVSGISAIIGGIVGTAVGYGLTATRHGRLRGALVALANVTANSGGITLAFAFITIIGVTGGLTIALKIIGIDLYSVFTLYSLIGLVIVYIYFQVPLMIVLTIPAFAALRREWHEASSSLGGTAVDFWRKIGIPILMPAIFAGSVLLFASGMGAFATAIALMGGQANVMTTQVAILRQGEVIFDPAQADAMATALLAFVALAVVAYHLIQRRTLRWLAQ
jgi:putative spermidine/putrescine transport system permease protein